MATINGPEDQPTAHETEENEPPFPYRDFWDKTDPKLGDYYEREWRDGNRQWHPAIESPELHSDSPHCTITLKMPSEVSVSEKRVDIDTTLTYLQSSSHTATGDETSTQRPFVIQIGGSPFDAGCWSQNLFEWNDDDASYRRADFEYDSDGKDGYLLADVEMPVKPGNNFACLRPGESHTTTTPFCFEFEGYTLTAGKKYALLWSGGKAFWWLWGSFEDHTKTVALTLNPTGEPYMKFAMSNIVYFTAIEYAFQGEASSRSLTDQRIDHLAENANISRSRASVGRPEVPPLLSEYVVKLLTEVVVWRTSSLINTP